MTAMTAAIIATLVYPINIAIRGAEPAAARAESDEMRVIKGASQPYRPGNKADGPGCCEKAAKKCSHAFASFKFKPDREAMSYQRGSPGKEAYRRAKDCLLYTSPSPRDRG